MTGPRVPRLSLSGAGLLLLLAFGLALALVAGSVTIPRLAAIGQQQIERNKSDRRTRIARRLIVYRLSAERDTTFRFSQPVLIARIISHPLIAARDVLPGKGWTYGYRAELVDANGEVIATREIHSNTIQLTPEGRRRSLLRYYRGTDDVCPPPDEVRIVAPRPFAALRLRTLASDPGVRAVDVRVSERRPLIDTAAATAFVRFSPDDRARLAEANAFSAEILTQEERVNIARNQWRPVGPQGIEGSDYQLLVLYEQGDGGAPDPESPEAGEIGG